MAMSAPRPLPWKIVALRVRHAGDVEVLASDSPITEYAERAVNSFDALLAVAKEAWDHRDDACRKPHTALDVALAQIEAKHPGWREWSA
jgi:hypothetical protein